MEALRWNEILVESESNADIVLSVKNDAVVHHNGLIYLLGGNNAGRMEVLVFSIKEEKWKRTYNTDSDAGIHNNNIHQFSRRDIAMGAGYKMTGTPPSHRNGHTATLVKTPTVFGDRARIFVIGGWSRRGGATNEVHILDISDPEESLAWLELEPEPSGLAIRGTVPGPCNLHSADFVSEQREIYVFRGGDGTEYHNDLHALNVDTLVWRQVAMNGTCPERRAHHASAFVPETNQIFIFGGWNGFCRLNDLHVFDVNTSTWSQPTIGGIKPQQRAGMSLTAVGKNLFIFGGVNAYTTLNDLHILDCDTMSFAKLRRAGGTVNNRTLGNGESQNPNGGDTIVERVLFGEGPRERSGHCAAAVGRLIYIIGGGCGQQRHNNVFVLDTDSLEFPHRIGVKKPADRIVSQLHGFCNMEELSDVTFIVEGREVYAHKLVLSLASEYYRAMFSNEFRERADRPRIEIPNCTYDAFLCLMRYIYGDDFDISSSIFVEESSESPSYVERTSERVNKFVDVLKLADQLLLYDLKHKCEETLQLSVNSSTVDFIFEVAKETHSEYLIYFCQHYKRNHAKHGVD